MLFLALEVARLGLLYKFRLNYLADASCSNEGQGHNTSLSWTKLHPSLLVTPAPVMRTTLHHFLNNTGYLLRAEWRPDRRTETMEVWILSPPPFSCSQTPTVRQVSPFRNLAPFQIPTDEKVWKWSVSFWDPRLTKALHTKCNGRCYLGLHMRTVWLTQSSFHRFKRFVYTYRIFKEKHGCYSIQVRTSENSCNNN